MTPGLAMTIDTARDLAWRPTSNLGGRRATAYEPRLESHRRLVDALAGAAALSANASPELRFLLAAIRRVALCSFSNRMGHPYYERKQAVAELRGCLLVYERSTGHNGLEGLVDRSAGPDGCWPWLGRRDVKGYGKLGDRRVTREVLAAALGRELTPAEQACHTCDNPPCCNPAHLFAGSASDNVRDMYAKGRQAAHSRPHSHCRRGHALTPDNVLIQANGRRCRMCRLANDRTPGARARERAWIAANHDSVLASKARSRAKRRARAATALAGPDLASSIPVDVKQGLAQRRTPEPMPALL